VGEKWIIRGLVPGNRAQPCIQHHGLDSAFRGNPIEITSHIMACAGVQFLSCQKMATSSGGHVNFKRHRLESPIFSRPEKGVYIAFFWSAILRQILQQIGEGDCFDFCRRRPYFRRPLSAPRFFLCLSASFLQLAAVAVLQGKFERCQRDQLADLITSKSIQARRCNP
jgi:hypothetical protein